MRSLLHLTYWKQNEWRHGNVLTDTCNTTYRMYWKIKVDAQVETQHTFKSNHGSEAEGRLSYPGTKRLLLFIEYSKMRALQVTTLIKVKKTQRRHKNSPHALHGLMSNSSAKRPSGPMPPRPTGQNPTSPHKSQPAKVLTSGPSAAPPRAPLLSCPEHSQTLHHPQPSSLGQAQPPRLEAIGLDSASRPQAAGHGNGHWAASHLSAPYSPSETSNSAAPLSW